MAAEGKAKQPFLYEVDGGKPFAFAGLWEAWRAPTGDAATPIETCTILTTDANEPASEVHNRMPVILDAADYDAWLAGEQIPLVPLPSDRMTVRPVRMFVNKAGNEGGQCIAPPIQRDLLRDRRSRHSRSSGRSLSHSVITVDSQSAGQFWSARNPFPPGGGFLANLLDGQLEEEPAWAMIGKISQRIRTALRRVPKYQ